jgi:hypothetical protein
MTTNLMNLVSVARSRGRAIASSWRAYCVDGAVTVHHYDTVMFVVNADDSVEPVNRGWGSMSDKKGTRKILTNVNGKGYADIYG